MPRPKKKLFSKSDLRNAIDRLKNTIEDKTFTALAVYLRVNPNLLYAWRKEGKKEMSVSPTIEDALKLAQLEKKLGLAETEDIISICKHWLMLSGRDEIPNTEIERILNDLESSDRVFMFEKQAIQLSKDSADISYMFKVLVPLSRKITIDDLFFLLKSEEDLGFKLTTPLVEKLLDVRDASPKKY